VSVLYPHPSFTLIKEGYVGHLTLKKS
jgi:hypothetical protein